MKFYIKLNLILLLKSRSANKINFLIANEEFNNNFYRDQISGNIAKICWRENMNTCSIILPTHNLCQKKNQWTLTLVWKFLFFCLKGKWKKQVESTYTTHIIPKVPFLHSTSLYLKKLSGGEDEALYKINFDIEGRKEM